MRHEDGNFSGHDGMELYYQHWQPDGPSKAIVIIVHGLGEHGGRYMNLVNVLVSQGYAVFAFDNRGHGQSPGQRGYVGCFSEFREDVQAFVNRINRQENPDGPLFLMGHSLGGLIVLSVVLHGVPGIDGVIISSPALDRGGISAFRMEASKVMSRIWPTMSVNTGLDVSGISRYPDVVSAYRNDPLTHGKGTPRLATESSQTISWCFEHADQLKIPVLIVHGTSDRITSPRRSREFFERITNSDKTYIAFDGGYHESHNDIDHEQTSAEILDWLDARVSVKTTDD